MALPTIADCFRVAINYTNANNLMTATNVIHVLAPGEDEDGVYAALTAAQTSAMWDPCTNALNVETIVITALDGTPDGKVFGHGVVTADGWRQNSGAQQFIPQAAAIIKLATAATGRSGRGRVYLPWVNEGAFVDGAIDAGARDNATNAWVDFANDLVAGGVAMAVASYLHSSAAQVLDLACEARSGTQRKRNTR